MMSIPETVPEFNAPSISFDVFISYSRHDVEFARRLEKTLESYKPPANVGLPSTTFRFSGMSPISPELIITAR